MEVHAAFEWGVPLHEWYKLPESIRGMMIAYLNVRNRIEELMAEEDESARTVGQFGISHRGKG